MIVIAAPTPSQLPFSNACSVLPEYIPLIQALTLFRDHESVELSKLSIYLKPTLIRLQMKCKVSYCVVWCTPLTRPLALCHASLSNGVCDDPFV